MANAWLRDPRLRTGPSVESTPPSHRKDSRPSRKQEPGGNRPALYHGQGPSGIHAEGARYTGAMARQCADIPAGPCACLTNGPRGLSTSGFFSSPCARGAGSRRRSRWALTDVHFLTSGTSMQTGVVPRPFMCLDANSRCGHVSSQIRTEGESDSPLKHSSYVNVNHHHSSPRAWVL